MALVTNRRIPVFMQRRIVRELAGRMQAGADSPQLPLIVENHVLQTRTVHLLVIWDEWENVSNVDRARFITDGFNAAYPQQEASTIIPMGLTASEALTLGYLPYRIVPSARKSNIFINRVMRSVGGVFLQIGAEKQLRFATRAQAEQAYRALASKMPKEIWTLVLEQPAAESA